MLDPKLTELKQIKLILLGILVCLVIIVLAIAPSWIEVALIAVGLYAVFAIVLAISRTARFAVSQAWWQLTTLWRR